jgi:hypothetical protein
MVPWALAAVGRVIPTHHTATPKQRLEQIGTSDGDVLELVDQDAPEGGAVPAALQVAHRLGDHIIEVDLVFRS